MNIPEGMSYDSKHCLLLTTTIYGLVKMSHDSLIGSTISIKSKKSVSCASKISSTGVLSHDTKTSKVSEKYNPHAFTLRTSIMHFSQT
jgi:hypothetical protein